MIPKLRRDQLAARLATLRELLKQVGANPVMRVGIEDQIAILEAELQAFANGPKTFEQLFAHVALKFGGAPVLATRGIATDFATDSVSKYQALVAAYSAAKHRESDLAQRGPFPQRHESRLYISGTIRGSFGFELAELREQQQMTFERSQLAEDVDEIAKLMASAAESDESFAAAIEKIDDRVIAKLRDFFVAVRNGTATFEIITGDIDEPFDEERVAAAAERTSAKILREEDVAFVGTFHGATAVHRRFDFRTDDGKEVTGKINPELTEIDIDAMNRKFSGKHCVAHVSMLSVERTTGAPHVRFTLLRVEPRTR